MDCDLCDKPGCVTFKGRLLCVNHMKQCLNDHHWDELQNHLDHLDVPKQRRTDLRWLLRNLHINNEGEHLIQAQDLAKILLKSDKP